MPFKKHNWVKYGRKGIQAELKIIDEDNRTLDFFRWTTSDRNTERRILDILKKSYNIKFSPTIKPKDSINESILDKNIDW